MRRRRSPKPCGTPEYLPLVTSLSKMNAANTQTIDPVVVQGRTLRLLFAIQIISGIGVGIGGSVGALLAAELVGVSVSGLVQSASVGGSALLALPAAEIVRRGGRRPSLAASYLIAAL